MKKIIIRVLVSIMVVIFVFSAGLWAGFSLNTIRKHFLSTNNSINDTNAALEGKQGFIEGISENIKNRFSLKPFEEAFEYISGDSLVTFQKQELLQAAIEGMLALLDDKHADYFTVDEYEKITESYSGTMSGIGIIVTQDDEGRVIVVKPLPGTPADSAGIRKGDYIIAVNGEDIADMVLENIVTLIKGEEGTSVDMTFFRPEEDRTFEVTIVRARFYVPNLFSEMIDGNIAYIQYTGFQDGGAKLLESEIDKLLDQGAESIIFDLRNNLGGMLDDAVAVCDLFMDSGTIVTVRGRTDNKEKVDEYFASNGKYAEIPLVVLINGFSASASELVAGALKDNGRAVLVGETSFGKGTVQVIHELSDGSGLKFTTAKYFLPSGVSIEGVGVLPDIEVALTAEDTEDLQLNRAIEEIKAIMDGQ